MGSANLFIEHHSEEDVVEKRKTVTLKDFKAITRDLLETLLRSLLILEVVALEGRAVIGGLWP